MEEAIAQNEGGLPCAPTRRLDTAAIGNLIAIHPLALYSEQASWVEATVEHLYQQQVHDGLFYQDIIHTGYNGYLTLQLASVMMMRRDLRYLELLDAVIEAGGNTCAWPEAIHPRSKGGCMGDGDHGWVIAELINLFRDIIVMERHGEIEIARGVPEIWFSLGQSLKVEKIPIDGGQLNFQLKCDEQGWSVHWDINSDTHFQNIIIHPPIGLDDHSSLTTQDYTGTHRWDNRY
jgi:hypothetical protein